jgi:NADPH:quinone reductase-like Zn-dependent oxidoreductase
MKAVRIHSYGGSDVLTYEDAPRPVPHHNEVLIRVHAAAINPVDWKIREGKHQLGHVLPLILGWDVSGVIEGIGPGATWDIGEEVYSRPNLMRNGGYAEYIVVAEAELAEKPKSVDHVHAAAVPLAGLTAWQALFDHGHLKTGQTVLIHAASGGVGSYAVQLAKWKGARVIATASGRNERFVKDLGADQFIDYTRQRFEDVARDVDLVIDTLAGDVQDRSLKVLKKGGTLVSTLQAPSRDKLDALGVNGTNFMAKTVPLQLAEMARLIDEGRLKVPVETVLPLSEARKAHELSQTGHARGKIVLKVMD